MKPITQEQAQELVAALQRAAETLAHYGASTRKPDEEAWGAYTQAVNALAKVSA